MSEDGGRRATEEARAQPRTQRQAGLSRAAKVAVGLAAFWVQGCTAKTNGVLVILQNQRVAAESVSTGPACVPTDELVSARFSGVLDIALDKPIGYQVFPLIQNRLSSLLVGGVERNSLAVSTLHMKIEPPAGAMLTFPAECPAEFAEPASATIEPGESRAFSARGMLPCHTAVIQQAAAAGALSITQTQPVNFTLSIKAIAERGGDTIESDEFRFGVSVCAYCLQQQGNATPSCAATPKPNPYKGNGCTPGQDDPGLLCCLDQTQGGKVICPAPDF